MIIADKLLHRLFSQLNPGHEQLSGALWANVEVAYETSYAGLIRGCGDDIRATAQKAVNICNIKI